MRKYKKNVETGQHREKYKKNSLKNYEKLSRDTRIIELEDVEIYECHNSFVKLSEYLHVH